MYNRRSHWRGKNRQHVRVRRPWREYILQVVLGNMNVFLTTSKLSLHPPSWVSSTYISLPGCVAGFNLARHAGCARCQSFKRWTLGVFFAMARLHEGHKYIESEYLADKIHEACVRNGFEDRQPIERSYCGWNCEPRDVRSCRERQNEISSLLSCREILNGHDRMFFKTFVPCSLLQLNLRRPTLKSQTAGNIKAVHDDIGSVPSEAKESPHFITQTYRGKSNTPKRPPQSPVGSWRRRVLVRAFRRGKVLVFRPKLPWSWIARCRPITSIPANRWHTALSAILGASRKATPMSVNHVWILFLYPRVHLAKHEIHTMNETLHSRTNRRRRQVKIARMSELVN